MICVCCNLPKPDDEFYPDARHHIGYCRECRTESIRFQFKEFQEKWDTWTMKEKRSHFSTDKFKTL